MEINDTLLPSDDDSEVVLQDSDLFKYLEQVKTSGFVVYNKTKIVPQISQPCALPERNLNECSISDEDSVLISSVLNSNLLLEEDASYLFKISSEFTVDSTDSLFEDCQSIWRYCAIMSCGAVLAISSYFSQLNKSYKYLLMSGSAIMFLPVLTKWVSISRRKKKLSQLLSVLQRIITCIKKMLKLIKEETSCILTKEIIHQMRNNASGVKNEYFCLKKRGEIACLGSKLMDSLNLAISSTRKAIVDLLNIKLEMSYSEHYLALLPDDQLRSSCNSNENETSLNVGALENLKNIFLLLQSEFLRVLGLSFFSVGKINNCKNVYSAIFKIVEIYFLDINYILQTLEKHYNYYSKPVIVSLEKQFLDNQFIDGYSSIHRVVGVLNSVIVELKELEEYLDKNKLLKFDDVKPYVGSNLVNIEKEFMDAFDCLKNTQRHFLKSVNDHKVKSDDFEKKSDGCIIKTGINVGFSDFSTSGIDEVFFGITNGPENPFCSDDYDETCSKPPRFFLSELKAALINKREEFKRREQNVLKEPDFEIDFDCIQKNNETNEKDNFNSCEMESDAIPNVEIAYDGFLSQKNVAAQAANVSLMWNTHKTEDFFSDDGD